MKIIWCEKNEQRSTFSIDNSGQRATGRGTERHRVGLSVKINMKKL